jgi:hypothetical protein
MAASGPDASLTGQEIVCPPLTLIFQTPQIFVRSNVGYCGHTLLPVPQFFSCTSSKQLLCLCLLKLFSLNKVRDLYETVLTDCLSFSS